MESGGKERNASFQVIIMFRGETLQINTVTKLDYWSIFNNHLVVSQSTCLQDKSMKWCIVDVQCVTPLEDVIFSPLKRDTILPVSTS